MPSIEPYISPHHEHCGQEVSGGFIVACGDGPELLEFSEEVLDQVTRLVHVFVIGARIFSVGFWRNDDLFSGPFERLYDSLVGVEGFIGKNGLGCDVRQKSVRTLKVAGLSGRQNEVERIAKRIDNSVYFCRQPAF